MKSIYLIILFVFACSGTSNKSAANLDSLALESSYGTVLSEKEVEGITINSSDFNIPVTTVGNIKAIKKGKIVAEVSGIFNFDYVYEGKTFNKGQVIGLVSDYSFETTYERQLNNVQKRYLDFLQDDVISSEYKNLKPLELLKKIQAAKDQNIIGRARSLGLYDDLLLYNSYETERNKRTILAPSAIIISRVFAENGQIVNKGSVLFDFIYDDQKVIEVSLFENESAYLKMGALAHVSRHSISQASSLNAHVIGISKQISADRFRKVTLSLDDFSDLVDGEQVDVTLTIKTGKRGIQIPNEAIVYRDQRPVVFIVENNLALWKYVQLGERFGNLVEITDGISSGDKLITKGHFTLAHQAKVSFKEQSTSENN